jgi:hypothetical protein
MYLCTYIKPLATSLVQHWLRTWALLLPLQIFFNYFPQSNIMSSVSSALIRRGTELISARLRERGQF